MQTSPKGETVSNRFYDTFTKFQKINVNREVPSPSFRKAGGKGLNPNAIKPDQMGRTTLVFSRNGKKNQSMIHSNRSSIHNLNDTFMKTGAGFARRSSKGSSLNVNVRTKEPTTMQKMSMMQVQESVAPQPFHIHDVLEKGAMNELSPQ